MVITHIGRCWFIVDWLLQSFMPWLLVLHHWFFLLLLSSFFLLLSSFLFVFSCFLFLVSSFLCLFGSSLILCCLVLHWPKTIGWLLLLVQSLCGAKSLHYNVISFVFTISLLTLMAVSLHLVIVSSCSVELGILDKLFGLSLWLIIWHVLSFYITEILGLICHVIYLSLIHI